MLLSSPLVVRCVRGIAALVPLPVHLVIGWVMAIATLALVGFYVPAADKVIGESYLIFFYHFPSAVNCLNMFLFAGAVSLVYLIWRSPRIDLWAASAVEVGVLACTVTLATGSVWAKAAWGIWWNVTDPRLMSVAVMWLIYVGYLALRNTIDEPVKRARFCAVFSILATLNVPMVLFSIRVLGQVNHPKMEVTMGETSMVVTRWFGAAAFLVLYTAFWRLRYRVHAYKYEGLRLEEGFSRAGI
jgi:heme exporter protein C